jgi:hypothetical protein
MLSSLAFGCDPMHPLHDHGHDDNELAAGDGHA